MMKCRLWIKSRYWGDGECGSCGKRCSGNISHQRDCDILIKLNKKRGEKNEESPTEKS